MVVADMVMRSPKAVDMLHRIAFSVKFVVYTRKNLATCHPTATESPAFTSSVAQLASAFDC
jgi:hypothetical protein